MEQNDVFSLVTGVAQKAALNNSSLRCREDSASIRKRVAHRMVESRELNGMSQTEAAEAFGYRNSTQLSQWEKGKRMPPILRLIQATSIYRVSLDYLLGLSDEPDRDPASAERRILLAAVEADLRSATQRLTDMLMFKTKRGSPAISTAVLIVQEGETMVNAYKRFVALNPKYEDMRGGNTLKVAAESFEHNGLAHARSHIERFQRSTGEALNYALREGESSQVSPDLFSS